MTLKNFIIEGLNCFLGSRRKVGLVKGKEVHIYKYTFGGDYGCTNCCKSLSGKSHWHIPYHVFFGFNTASFKICKKCAPTSEDAFEWIRERREELEKISEEHSRQCAQAAELI